MALQMNGVRQPLDTRSDLAEACQGTERQQRSLLAKGRFVLLPDLEPPPQVRSHPEVRSSQISSVHLLSLCSRRPVRHSKARCIELGRGLVD
ncbi:hypothetical protein D9M72_532090 [compost metagenome]